MNLKELDSFKMADAVTFHDELNPKLWNNNHLRPEVREQLILIAEDFLSELGINDVDVDDITVSGSNAAYSYTPHSDLDLHLLVDMSRYDDDIYKEFFNAKKALYNEAHDIKIHGVPVEVYVQDSREPVVSLGEYSVLQNKWLRIPTKRRANFDQTTTQAKYNTLKELIELALKSKDLKKVNKIIRKIKQYRQAGLDKGGEFGPENLAYKALRSQGLITKLYDLRDKLHSEILTIETMYQNPEQMVEEEEKSELPTKVYHVTPASNLDSIMQAGLRPQVGSRSSQIPGEQSAIYCFPDKASLEDAMMNWLGDEFDEDEELALLEIDTTNLTGEYSPNAEFEIAITSLIPPNRIKVLSSNLVTITESFNQPYQIQWEHSDYGDVDANAKLADGTNLNIMFNNQGDDEWQVEFYRNNSQEVSGEGDAQRVFATVLTAIQQFIQKEHPWRLTFSASKDNWAKQKQNSESRASLYTKLVQRYARAWGYDEYDEDHGDLVTYELTRLKEPVAEATDPTQQDLKDVAGWMNTTPDKLKVVTKQEPIEKFIKQIREMYGTYDEFPEDEDRTNRILKLLKRGAQSLPIYVEANDPYLFVMEGRHRMVAFWLAGMKTIPVAYVSTRIEEASGYIPSEKEKNDPRFKTALTVDVKPDSIKKNAKSFYWKTSRAGIPPTAKPNGKF